MRPALVLIGPAGSGKSTVGALVAASWNVPFVDADAAAGPAYAEVGWSIERLVERIEAVGRVAAEREWEVARAHAVTSLVTQSPGAVLALGAGHTSYTDPTYRAAVRATLAPLPSVVLLLPHPEPAVSLRVLRERCLATKGTDWRRDGQDFLAQWLLDPQLSRLATAVHHTDGQTPEQTASALMADLPGPRG